MQGVIGTTEEIRLTLQDLRGGANSDDRLRKSLTHLSNVLEKIDNGTGTLGAFINDRSVFDTIKRMVGGSSKDKFIKSLVRETIQSADEK